MQQNIFSPSQLSVQTLLQSLYGHLCAVKCINICVHIPFLVAIPFYGHKKQQLHALVGMGSTALAAAAAILTCGNLNFPARDSQSTPPLQPFPPVPKNENRASQSRPAQTSITNEPREQVSTSVATHPACGGHPCPPRWPWACRPCWTGSWAAGGRQWGGRGRTPAAERSAAASCSARTPAHGCDPDLSTRQWGGEDECDSEGDLLKDSASKIWTGTHAQRGLSRFWRLAWGKGTLLISTDCPSFKFSAGRSNSNNPKTLSRILA